MHLVEASLVAVRTWAAAGLDGVSRLRAGSVATALGLAWLVGGAALVRADGAPADLQAAYGAFREQRYETAAALTEPIAACVVRRDTSHAAFHGCVDWHSAVHGVWALLAYSRMSGDRRHDALIQRVLDPDRIAAERAFLSARPDFEMPYGRAWFLRLAIEYRRQFDNGLLDAFAADMADSLVAHYRAHPPSPLSRSYRSASWALINLYDYGEATGNERISDFVASMVRGHFLEFAEPCPVRNEESAWPDFMAVCTNWAWLVSRILPPQDLRVWLADLLPEDVAIRPITMPQTPHHHGMNFSRAWGLWGIYAKTGEERFLRSYLAHFDENFRHSDWWRGDYRTVAHWVAQFGMFALAPAFQTEAK